MASGVIPRTVSEKRQFWRQVVDGHAGIDDDLVRIGTPPDRTNLAPDFFASSLRPSRFSAEPD